MTAHSNDAIFKAESLQLDLEQVAREIYYAMAQENLDAARANLEMALQILGVRGPRDIGLSESVMTRWSPSKARRCD